MTDEMDISLRVRKSFMWLVKFHYGVITIEQRTIQDLHDIKTCCNVIAKMYVDIMRSYPCIVDNYPLDNVTVEKL